MPDNNNEYVPTLSFGATPAAPDLASAMAASAIEAKAAEEKAAEEKAAPTATQVE